MHAALPSRTVYDSPLQVSHREAPADTANELRRHAVQSGEPGEDAYRPAVQSTHEVGGLDTSDVRPTAHGRHAVIFGRSLYRPGLHVAQPRLCANFPDSHAAHDDAVARIDPGSHA